MTSGTQYKQGDVVLVPFPFSDLSATKQRPVLVLTKKQQGDDIITCGITSNLQDKTNGVLLNRDNMLDGKIPKTSMIKVDKLFTLEAKLVKRTYGRLTKSTLQKVRHVFHDLV